MNLGKLIAALRLCSRCKCWKPPSDFYGLRDRLQSRCKRCVIEGKAEWRAEQYKKLGTHEGFSGLAHKFITMRTPHEC